MFLFALIGCNYDDVPQAHRGRYFDRSSAVCTGGHGFTGQVLPPGSYYVGLCDQVRLVDCGTLARKEVMASLTKDGVQFGLDVYVRFSANCADTAITTELLDTVAPAKGKVVSADQIYDTYVRPILGETVRETISPYAANGINQEREKILKNIRTTFVQRMNEAEPKFVQIQEINLSNMDFPDEMDHANTERATQAVLKDKAIAERERVEAEIETTRMRQSLALEQGRVEAARIDQIGAALARNPEYLTYQLQQQMPSIYEKAGATGNMVITAPDPTIMMRGSGK